MEFYSDERRKDETRKGSVDEKIRYDRCDHLPACSEILSKCALEGCDSKSSIFCYKCKVHLCLNEEKNCFNEYHYK